MRLEEPDELRNVRGDYAFIGPDHRVPETFGRCGFDVSILAAGRAPLGNMLETFGFGVPEEEAPATIRAALDSRMPFIDTAAFYGDGESECRVGIVLRERGGLPPEAFLETKQGRDPKTNDYSGETIKRRMERSLELPGVDRVEVVYLHDAEWTPFAARMARGGPVEVLHGFKEQGVIGHLGVAAGPVELEMQYVETGVFDAVITHNRYTLLNRRADELIDLSHARGIAAFNAALYSSGILAKGPAAYPRHAYQQASPETIARVHRIAVLCDR